jgi:FG-GAP repeat
MSCAKLSPILLLSVTRAWCAGEPHPGQDARSPLPNAGRSNISAALVPISQLTELTASDGAAGDAIGTAVAIGGDTVVVGAPNETINGNTYQGAAYVFVKPASGWSNLTPVAKLTASDNPQLFGAPVAISGDTIVVGAPWSNRFGGATFLRNHGADGPT